MKKVLLASMAIFLSVLSSFAGVQDNDDPHGNGFRLNFNFGLTGGLYGADVDADKDLYKESEAKPGLAWGLSLGNKWTFTRFSDDKMSVGLMVDWVDFSFASKSYKVANQDYFNSVLNVAFLKVGPSFTYALNDKMGLDAYYQLRPTYGASIGGDSDDPNVAVGFGFTHAVGVAFRYGLLNVALEPNFGSVETVNVDFENDKRQMSLGNTRIVIGFKF